MIEDLITGGGIGAVILMLWQGQKRIQSRLDYLEWRVYLLSSRLG